jgi:hypothetical protein
MHRKILRTSSPPVPALTSNMTFLQNESIHTNIIVEGNDSLLSFDRETIE